MFRSSTSQCSGCFSRCIRNPRRYQGGIHGTIRWFDNISDDTLLCVLSMVTCTLTRKFFNSSSFSAEHRSAMAAKCAQQVLDHRWGLIQSEKVEVKTALRSPISASVWRLLQRQRLQWPQRWRLLHGLKRPLRDLWGGEAVLWWEYDIEWGMESSCDYELDRIVLL